MLRRMCKSKIHNGTVTAINLQHATGVSVDAELLKATDILPNERVQILNLNNGFRAEAPVAKEKAGSGTICANGAIAKFTQVGDRIIILSYIWIDSKEAISYRHKLVSLNKSNRIKK